MSATDDDCKTNCPAHAGRILRLVREFVVWRYVSAGLAWGAAESYSGYLGECVGYTGMLRRLNRWEARYVRLGFKPVDKRVWVDAGGYGKDYASKLYLPNSVLVQWAEASSSVRFHKREDSGFFKAELQRLRCLPSKT